MQTTVPKKKAYLYMREPEENNKLLVAPSLVGGLALVARGRAAGGLGYYFPVNWVILAAGGLDDCVILIGSWRIG